MLASHNVVMIRMVLKFAMSTSETQMVDVRAMSPAIGGMTAVQMHKHFVYVSELINANSLQRGMRDHTFGNW